MKRELIPAAVYLRRSTRKQEKSIREQRSEVNALAERGGYSVEEYVDSGITGDSGPDRRPEFGRMLRDIKAGKFAAVLTWDLSRIGRFDSLDAGRWLSVLRDADVKIVTCCDGEFDLTDSFDRMKLGWQSEGNNQENIKRAANTIRGLVDVAKRGFSAGGPSNYALDRGEYKPDGELVRRLGPGDTKGNRSHYVGPVLSEDQDKLDAVRYIFTRYTKAFVSTRRISDELNAKGYSSPARGGGLWLYSHVSAILRNPIYCGLARWGERSTGRYFTQVNGTPTKRPKKDAGWQANPDGLILVDSPVEPLISRELFEKARKRLELRSKRRADRCGTRAEHPLSGLLVCEHCDRKMHFTTIVRPDRSGKPRYSYRRFVCQSFQRRGTKYGCPHYTVGADDLLRWLIVRLQAMFLGPGRDILHKAVREALEAAQSGEGTDRLRKRLDKLNRKGDRLRRAIASLDDDGLVGQLAAVKTEQTEVQEELARSGQVIHDLDAETRATVDGLWTLAESLDDEDVVISRK